MNVMAMDKQTLKSRPFIRYALDCQLNCNSFNVIDAHLQFICICTLRNLP